MSGAKELWKTKVMNNMWFFAWLALAELAPGQGGQLPGLRAHKKTYCFYCFLFKQPGRADQFGSEVFTRT
jgi:hypothetical protein